MKSLKKIEDHNKEIGDEEEGNLTSIMDGHTTNPNDPSTISPQISRVLKSKKLVFKDPVTIMKNFNEFTDNCYVFSTSTILSKDIMRCLGKDSCLEIKEAEIFFCSLTKFMEKLFKHINGYNMDKVEYVEKIQHHSVQTSTMPIFTKPPRFSYQKEYRFIWTSNNPNTILPETFSCPDVIEFISLAI